MQEEETKSEGEAPARGRGKMLGLVALAGAAAGLAAVFVINGTNFGGSSGGGRCEASSALASNIAPLVKGSIASLQVSGTAADVSNLSFKSADGKAYSMADFKGKAVLLNLWATWCAPCRKEMPDLDHLQAELGGDDFEVVTVSIDRSAPGVAQKFFDDIKLKHLTLYYDESMQIFQDLKGQGMAFGMPTTLVVDKEGCSLGHMAGPAPWSDETAQTMLKAVIGKQ